MMLVKCGNVCQQCIRFKAGRLSFWVQAARLVLNKGKPGNCGRVQGFFLTASPSA